MDKPLPTHIANAITDSRPERKNALEERIDEPKTWHPTEQVKCAYCDKTVFQTKIECRKLIHPWSHWRCYCNNCNCVRDPDTGEFSIPKARSNQITQRMKARQDDK